MVIAALCALPFCASAQTNGHRRERAGILLGAFITDRNTEARVDASDGSLGSDLDLESDLGLESSTSVVRFGGFVWLGERHRIDVSYFDLSRDASNRIDETIEFGDKVFAVDTVVDSSNKLTITKVDYVWSAISRDRGFFGIGGGLYVSETKLTLREASIGAAESRGITAPLPVLGLRGEYAFDNRWTVRGATQWFGIDTDTFGGRLLDAYVGADHGLGKHMAVGLAYNALKSEVTAHERRLSGTLDWGYDGYLLYFKYDFGQ
jgi:hypothetical protein